MTRKFHTAYDDGGYSRTVLLSDEINHGDWPFRFAIVIENFEDSGLEDLKENGKWNVEIMAVSPVAAAAHKESVLRSMDAEDRDDIGDDELCCLFLEYGIAARLWDARGKNRRKLIQAAGKEMPQIDGLFGFYMDRTQNAIGETGWDWIEGGPGSTRY